MNITNDNHKGCSLEEFVDFNLESTSLKFKESNYS